MKYKEYKPNTTKRNVRFNMNELNRRLNNYALINKDNVEYMYDGGDYYLCDGVSVSPQIHALMIGAVDHPNPCSCEECVVCIRYHDVEHDMHEKAIKKWEERKREEKSKYIYRNQRHI